MFKLVLFLSLKYFFYYKDSSESLLSELKISQKRREAAAHLSSPFPVSTAVPEESEPGQMCPCCFSHGQAWQVGSVPASLALEFGWSLETLRGLSYSLLWYPQHSYVQMQSKFVTSFGFLVISQVLFWDSNKVQVSAMWQCWWCSTSHGLSKPAGWPEVAISCLKQNSGGWCPENEWNQAEKLKYSLQVIQKRMGKRIKHPDSVLCCQGWAVSWHTVLQVCNIVIRSLNHTQLDKCH